MLKLKKSIDAYLKYPLMWVMLLWAFTMPGQEVKVYNFLLHALAGKPIAEFVHARHEVSSSEKQADYAYFEPAPAPSFSAKIKFQLLDPISGSLVFSSCTPVSFISSSLYGFIAATGKDQLLIAVLPNAP